MNRDFRLEWKVSWKSLKISKSRFAWSTVQIPFVSQKRLGLPWTFTVYHSYNSWFEWYRDGWCYKYLTISSCEGAVEQFLYLKAMSTGCESLKWIIENSISKKDIYFFKIQFYKFWFWAERGFWDKPMCRGYYSFKQTCFLKESRFSRMVERFTKFDEHFWKWLPRYVV